MKLSVFAEDQDLKSQGVPIYPTSDDGYFLVPRVGGFQFQKQIQKITKQIYGIYHNQEDIELNRVYAAWLGEFVTGWDGVLDSEDNELEFSRGNCRAVFNNEAYRDSLVPLLIEKASRYENYLTQEGREAIEELKKL